VKSPPPAGLLLGRPEVLGDVRKVARDLVGGRRVLVTGAAGSVGSALAPVLLAADPAALVLLDHHEYSLFTLERSLGSGVFELVDVRDLPRMTRVFDTHQPEIVLHLAAAKHVPYGERFPEGAVASNILGTAHLLELARQAGVRTLIYPSSDKSVDPPSLYGATKRIGEALTQTAGGAVVRFVNIIGTRGSVIETFTHQILSDRPLTVTDRRMTRYWISMAEALWSLVAAAYQAEPGQVVTPECGEPVALLETARRLAGWYRPERDPYPIACTGVRPGERLHEVLLSANEAFSDAAAHGPAEGLRGVHRTASRNVDQLPRLIEQLGALIEAGDRPRLRELCMQAALELQ
jgi:dTDP-glucose 4,6-dehydratase